MKEIEMVRGDTLIVVFPLFDEDDKAITMDDIETLFLTARRFPRKESAVLFSKEKKDFSIVDGLYEVEILPTDTETMSLTNFFFDIEVTLKDGTRKSVVCQIDLAKDYTIHGGDDIES